MSSFRSLRDSFETKAWKPVVVRSSMRLSSQFLNNVIAEKRKVISRLIACQMVGMKIQIA